MSKEIFIPKLRNVLYYEDIFSKNECLGIINSNKEFSEAAFGYDKHLDPKFRKTKISLIKYQNNKWISERILPLIKEANQRNYCFQIDSVSDFHLLKYESGSHYGWHLDLGESPSTINRKLSLIVFLSDKNDYQGGRLLFEPINPTDFNFACKQGSVVIFPSYEIHMVEKIISGLRYTLVCWIYGPPFS